MAFLPLAEFSIHKSSQKQEILGKHVLMITNKDLSCGMEGREEALPVVLRV